MCLDTNVIFEPSIGAHLGQALRASPILGGLNQRLADTLPAQVFIYVPAFDVADWAVLAALGVFTRARFEKTT